MRKHSSGTTFYSLSKMGRWYLFRSAISKDTLQGADLAYVKQNFKFSSHDFWVKHFKFLKEIH
jgi:hypothetical protein